MIELAVFDMAGTTIDDDGAVYRALGEAVTGAGATLSDHDLQTWMGTDKVQAITALLALGGVEPSDELVTERFTAFKKGLAEAYRAEPPTAFEGVPEAIAALRERGIKVALSTGFDRPVVDALLGSLGWSVASGTGAGREAQDPAVDVPGAVVVDAVITTSDVPAGRPAPYLIHRAMEAVGVLDVALVLAAGDTLVDLQAARNAGAISVGVLTGALDRAALEEGPFDYIVSGVAAIPELAETRPSGSI